MDWFSVSLDKLVISKFPHTIPPHEERVLLLRKKFHSEKTSMGILESDSAFPQPTLISVHTNRIVVNGCRQMGTLADQASKNPDLAGEIRWVG